MKNKNKQTKFPVARIKKIMQKDEEVGKVAQATPVVISKALELFLAFLVNEAEKVTTERGSKKVEAYHLKHAVDTTEMLDFLKEIVQAVPDPSAGGTIDLDAEIPDGPKKKRGKGKKAAAGGEGGVGGNVEAPKRRRKKKGEVQEEASASANAGQPRQGENGSGDAVMYDRDADEEGEDDQYPRRRNSDDDEDEWQDR